MQKLWLSSSALGSFIPNLGRFFGSNTLAKMTIWRTLLRADISPPWTYVIQILVSEFQSQLRCYFLKCTHFWPCNLIWDILATLHQLLHNLYRNS